MNDWFVTFTGKRVHIMTPRAGKHTWVVDEEGIEPLPEFIFGFPPAGAKIEFMHLYQKIYLSTLGNAV